MGSVLELLFATTEAPTTAATLVRTLERVYLCEISNCETTPCLTVIALFNNMALGGREERRAYGVCSIFGSSGGG